MDHHHQEPEMNMNMRAIMSEASANGLTFTRQASYPSAFLHQERPGEMSSFSETKLINANLSAVVPVAAAAAAAAAAPTGCLSSANATVLLKNTFGSKKAKKLLPEDYAPNCHTVLVGRSRDCQDHPGNQRLRVIVQAYLQEYHQATDKMGKTAIVSKVFDAVRAGNPMGHFVKKEQGRYYEVGERTARERIGAMFRDNLGSKYKASSAQQRAKQVTGARRESASSSIPIKVDVVDTSNTNSRRHSAPDALPALTLPSQLQQQQPLSAGVFFDPSQLALMEDLSTFQW